MIVPVCIIFPAMLLQLQILLFPIFFGNMLCASKHFDLCIFIIVIDSTIFLQPFWRVVNQSNSRGRGVVGKKAVKTIISRLLYYASDSELYDPFSVNLCGSRCGKSGPFIWSLSWRSTVL